MTQSDSSQSCSFCDDAGVASERVGAGPKDYICFSCVTAFTKRLTQPALAPAGTHDVSPICSF